MAVTSDSRKVKAGDVFVAIPGVKVDGASFILSAIKKGASKIVVRRGTKLPKNISIPVVEVTEPRLTLSELAASAYPNQPPFTVAVTGTNGKTSTVSFVRQLGEMAGIKSASVGTLGVDSADYTEPESCTTPDPVFLHQILNTLFEKGVDICAMEASSHGLDQYRMHSVILSAAGFTNLTRDHLDYHKDIDTYLAAKNRLFSEVLPERKPAILNADDDYSARILVPHGQKIFYGRKGRDLTLAGQRFTSDGQVLDLNLFGTKTTIHFPVIGDFQAYNMLCAVGLLLERIPLQQLIQFLPQLKAPRGRMEFVGKSSKGASIYIDYAHTPDALMNALRTIRPHTSGKLHVVFGCGGDRDPGKRPMMGKIATQFADHVYVTDDNPRSEDPKLIRAAILAEAPKAKEFDDRAKAIAAAVHALKPEDVLIVAGKGHETYQVLKSGPVHFDDKEEILKVIGGAK